MEKKWCRHIEFVPLSGWTLDSWLTVPRKWKVCPICEAERPTKANIAAATNQALQDAGDEE